MFYYYCTLSTGCSWWTMSWTYRNAITVIMSNIVFYITRLPWQGNWRNGTSSMERLSTETSLDGSWAFLFSMSQNYRIIHHVGISSDEPSEIHQEVFHLCSSLCPHSALILMTCMCYLYRDKKGQALRFPLIPYAISLFTPRLVKTFICSQEILTMEAGELRDIVCDLFVIWIIYCLDSQPDCPIRLRSRGWCDDPDYWTLVAKRLNFLLKHVQVLDCSNSSSSWSFVVKEWLSFVAESGRVVSRAITRGHASGRERGRGSSTLRAVVHSGHGGGTACRLYLTKDNVLLANKAEKRKRKECSECTEIMWCRCA